MGSVNEEQLDIMIANTVASMGFEGIQTTAEEIETMRKIGHGETTVDEEIRKYIELHKVK